MLSAATSSRLAPWRAGLLRGAAIASLLLALFSAAPAAAAAAQHRGLYYEIGQPAGPYAGKHARGAALVIHGGGWRAKGFGAIAAMRPHARRLREQGFVTVNVDYRGGGEPGFRDVVNFYDRMRARMPVGLPLCALGGSAGGHYALLLAAARPTLDCVIAHGAPAQLDLDPHPLNPQQRHWQRLAREAFAPHLEAASPTSHVASMRALVLFANTLNDGERFAAQVCMMERLRPTRTWGVVLEPGATRFAHNGASLAAVAELQAVERTFLNRVAGARPLRTARRAAPPTDPYCR